MTAARPSSVLLAGGGTAGHVSPLLALADCLRRRDPDIARHRPRHRAGPRGAAGARPGATSCVDRPQGAAARDAPPATCSASRATCAPPWRAAGRAIDETGAEVVVGFGGYVSTPAYLAARSGGCPIVVHEQNARAGLANRLGRAVHPPRRARRSPRHRPARTRRSSACRCAARSRCSTARPGATRALEHFGLDPQWPTLLVTGGSLGAQRLNDAFAAARPTRSGRRASRCCTSPARARSSSRSPRSPGAPYVVARLRRPDGARVRRRRPRRRPCRRQHRVRADRRRAARRLRPAADRQRRAAASTPPTSSRPAAGSSSTTRTFTPEWIDDDARPARSATRTASHTMGDGRGDGGGARRRRAARRPGRPRLRRVTAERDGERHQRRASTSTRPSPTVEELGRVHFIAIGGAGMSGVARLMLARGCPVSGSDAEDSPVLTALRDGGRRACTSGHDAGARRRRRHRRRSRRRSARATSSSPPRASAGLRVLHRSQALATHDGRHRGAWRSPAPTARPPRPRCSPWRSQHCGADPSFAAGGELAKHGTNAHWGTGDVVRRRGRRERRLVPRLPARGRHRDQRAARPPRLLRHLRRRRGGVCRVRRVRQPTAACSSPATTTPGSLALARGRARRRAHRVAHLRLGAGARTCGVSDHGVATASRPGPLS